MTPFLALGILAVYFIILIYISHVTSKGADTTTFFTANKQSPWYLVAFAMIGTSISGVTFISVPGLVGVKQFAYFQMVLGYILGYIFIAKVLMPLYYKLNLVSIYSYLEDRLGFWSYKTGSAFFLISRTMGSAVRLYIAVQVLQLAIYSKLGVPFEVSVAITIALIWVYTYKGGIKTIIITDTLQTTFLISAVALTIYLISSQLNLGFEETISSIKTSNYSQIFFFEDWFADKNNFFKQFLSGALITMVMTGLDQDLMQKNLTCKNIGEAQKNMFWFTGSLVFVNILFLCLGALLYIYATNKGIAIPAKSDDLYPMLALENFGNGGLGIAGVLVACMFLIGITAATYASSDSALTALTTSFCIDFMNIEKKPEVERQKIKHYVHIGFSVLFFVVVILFKYLNSKDVISALFTIASYTYGPLLGLFAFGLYSNRKVGSNDKFVPIVCILAPIITYVLVQYIETNLGYKFVNENLLLNGAITFFGIFLLSNKNPKTS
jgi:Na+/proline symporter